MLATGRGKHEKAAGEEKGFVDGNTRSAADTQRSCGKTKWSSANRRRSFTKEPRSSAKGTRPLVRSRGAFSKKIMSGFTPQGDRTHQPAPIPEVGLASDVASLDVLARRPKSGTC